MLLDRGDGGWSDCDCGRDHQDIEHQELEFLVDDLVVWTAICLKCEHWWQFTAELKDIRIVQTSQ